MHEGCIHMCVPQPQLDKIIAWIACSARVFPGDVFCGSCIQAASWPALSCLCIEACAVS